MDKKILEKKTVAELKALAKELKITGITSKTKPQLINSIIQQFDNSSIKENVTPSKDVSEKEAKKEVSEVNSKSQTPSSREVVRSDDVIARNEVTKQSKVEVKENVESPSEKSDDKVVNTEKKPIRESVNSLISNKNSDRSVADQSNSDSHKSTSTQANKQTDSHQLVNPLTRNNQSNNNRNQNFQRNNQHTNTQTRNPQHNNSQANNFSNDATVEVTGVLDIMSDGTHGVLRTQKLAPSDKDTYISISQVKKLKLRKGDIIIGTARLPKENERYFSLLWIKSVNGIEIENLKDRPFFEDLKPVYPDKQIKLEIGQFPIANRIIDMLAPIGYGQRAMIVAPPKAGKTTLLKDIAKGINENYPDITLMVVLIGERPEEVTDIERSVKGIVYASNFDDSPANQVAVAELSLERAKRLVESGKDVIILMDSLTRLARAYNVALPASGRTLSGGLDPVSLYPSKRFFGAARNFENGASLTIVATSLVETGSKMDDVIFEEFKGTGNMELKLDRRMANKRVFPAINLLESGTRNEELLLGQENLQNSWKIRRMLESLGDEGNEALIDRMKTSKSNEEFMNTLHQY